jgi:hypothetical protein
VSGACDVRRVGQQLRLGKHLPCGWDGKKHHTTYAKRKLMSLTSYATLGRSGLRVSPFTLGTMTFGEDLGWGSSAEESKRILAAYLDRGATRSTRRTSTPTVTPR